jgi:hypothetical protein
MPDSKRKTGSKRERENVNMREPYEVAHAPRRKTPSKNHPGLTPRATKSRAR